MSVFLSDSGTIHYAFLSSNVGMIALSTFILAVSFYGHGNVLRNMLKGLEDVFFDVLSAVREEAENLLSSVKAEGSIAFATYPIQLAERIIQAAAAVTLYCISKPREAASSLYSYFHTPQEPGRGEGRLIGEIAFLLFPLGKAKMLRGGYALPRGSGFLREALKWLERRPKEIVEILRIRKNAEDG